MKQVGYATIVPSNFWLQQKDRKRLLPDFHISIFPVENPTACRILYYINQCEEHIPRKIFQIRQDVSEHLETVKSSLNSYLSLSFWKKLTLPFSF